MIKSRCTNAIQANKNGGETLFSTAFNTLRGVGEYIKTGLDGGGGAKSLLRTI